MDFKALVQWKKSIESMPLKRPIVCPVDGFPLETYPKTQEPWCPFCGWPWIKNRSSEV